MKRVNHEQRFATIVTADEDADTAGFFWCGGATWDTRDYRCVLLAVPSDKTKKHLSAAIELHADTPEELAAEMTAHAMEPLTVEEIRRACESAVSSPRKRRPATLPHAPEQPAPPHEEKP